MKNIIIQSFSGFIFWTGLLTPYMILVVGTTKEQYLAWVGMQLLIVPVLAPLSMWFMNKCMGLFNKNEGEIYGKE